MLTKIKHTHSEILEFDFSDIVVYKSAFTISIPLDYTVQADEIRIASIDKDELLRRF